MYLLYNLIIITFGVRLICDSLYYILRFIFRTVLFKIRLLVYYSGRTINVAIK